MSVLMQGFRASFNRAARGAVLALGLLLAACGGGGGGTTTTPPSVAVSFAPQSATITPTTPVVVTVSNATTNSIAQMTCGSSVVATAVVPVGTTGTGSATLNPPNGGLPLGTCTASNSLDSTRMTYDVACGTGLAPDSTGNCVPPTG